VVLVHGVAALRGLHRDGLDDDVLQRAVAVAGRRAADLLHDLEPFDDLAEDRVAIVQMRCGRERDEELSAVGVRTTALLCRAFGWNSSPNV
jgi:hypothetical protein